MKKSIAIICALMTPSVAVLNNKAWDYMKRGNDKHNMAWTTMTKTPKNRIEVAKKLWKGILGHQDVQKAKDQEEILAAMHGVNGQNCVNSVLALDEPGSLRMALYLIGKDTCNAKKYLPWLKTSHEEVCLQERFMGMVKHDPSGLIGFHLESVYRNIAEPKLGIEEPKWGTIGELSDIWTKRQFDAFVEHQAERVPEQCSMFLLTFDPESKNQKLHCTRIIGPQKKPLMLPGTEEKQKPEIKPYLIAMNDKAIDATLDDMHLEESQRDEIKHWIKTHLTFWQNPDKRSKIMEKMGINEKWNKVKIPKLETQPNGRIFQIEDYKNKMRTLLQDKKGEINLDDDKAIEKAKQNLYSGPKNKHKRNEVNSTHKGLIYLRDPKKFCKEYDTFLKNYYSLIKDTENDKTVVDRIIQNIKPQSMTVMVFDFPASLDGMTHPNITMHIPEMKQNEWEQHPIGNNKTVVDRRIKDITPHAMGVTVGDFSESLDGMTHPNITMKIPGMKQNAAEQHPIESNEEVVDRLIKNITPHAMDVTVWDERHGAHMQNICN